MLKELPRVLTLFDIDMELQPARAAVRYQFTKHGKIKDPKCVYLEFISFIRYISLTCCLVVLIICRVVELMVAKGYMELEETLMMWKQKTHLMSLFEVSASVILSYAFLV